MGSDMLTSNFGIMPERCGRALAKRRHLAGCVGGSEKSKEPAGRRRYRSDRIDTELAVAGIPQ
jgi:hypothetical protein